MSKTKHKYRLLSIVAILMIPASIAAAITRNPSPEPDGSIIYSPFYCAADSVRTVVVDYADENHGKSQSHTIELHALKDMGAIIDSLYDAGKLCCIRIEGNASPEGSLSYNLDLARKRAANTADWIVANTKAQRSIISIGSKVHSWKEATESALALNDALDKENISVNDIQNRTAKGREWLDRVVFPAMRTTAVTIVGEKDPVIVAESVADSPSDLIMQEEEEEITTVQLPYDEWRRKMYIKTNMPAWLMLWTNVAVEYDLAKHFSFTVPVYYSGMNYFKRTLKFRTFGLQPEFRYWPKANNRGFFVGAHFGVFYYNVAFNHDKRYQDHGGHTPALGGGIAVGWKWDITKSGRWQLEATLGAGVYHLDYDIFQNKYGGLIVDRKKRTFFGIDQAAFSISYSFGLDKKQKKNEE